MSIGRTRSLAISAYLESVRRIVGCVCVPIVSARSPVPTSSGRNLVSELAVLLNGGNPAALRASQPLTLRVAQQCEIGPPSMPDLSGWSITTAGYVYVVALGDGREVIAFHRHPIEAGTVATSHLHIGPAATGSDATFLPGRFHKVHIPTGTIALQGVIRMLVTEFGVEPRRADWEGVLAEAADG